MPAVHQEVAAGLDYGVAIKPHFPFMPVVVPPIFPFFCLCMMIQYLQIVNNMDREQGSPVGVDEPN
jgi:hypothetical protein